MCPYLGALNLRHQKPAERIHASGIVDTPHASRIAAFLHLHKWNNQGNGMAFEGVLLTCRKSNIERVTFDQAIWQLNSRGFQRARKTSGQKVSRSGRVVYPRRQGKGQWANVHSSYACVEFQT